MLRGSALYHKLKILINGAIWVKSVLSVMPVVSTFYYVSEKAYRGSPQPAPPSPTITTDLREKEAICFVLLWVSVVFTLVNQIKPLAKDTVTQHVHNLGNGCVMNPLEWETDRQSCFLFSSSTQPFYWSSEIRPKLRFRANAHTRTALIWAYSWIQCDLKMMHDGNSLQTGAVH